VAAAAQDLDPESSRLEITGSFWSVDASGSIHANGTPIDLKSDLGVNQGQATFTGKLVAKPRRKQKIVVQGTPVRLDGSMNLSRSITYRGQTYSVSDRITSKADLNYFYAGYQYDLISRPGGHFGLEAGGAWLNATGTIVSQTTGITASKSETVGLPLAGAEFRVFPVHRRFDVEINGEVKGMAFGRYGHYVQASANAGIGFGPVLVEGGYRIVDMDIHTNDQISGVAPQFTGPVLSLVFRIP
jgi:hypothetical protein